MRKKFLAYKNMASIYNRSKDAWWMRGGKCSCKYACDSNLERESFVSIWMVSPQIFLGEKPNLKPNTYYNC